VILGKVGASSSLTASIAGISSHRRAMKAAGIVTWVVTGSSWSTSGTEDASATVR